MDSSTHKSLVVFFSHISQTADLKRLQSVLVQFFTSNRSIISFCIKGLNNMVSFKLELMIYGNNLN